MSILDTLKAASKNKLANTLDKTDLCTRDLAKTPIPAINIALSGEIDGGLGNGLTIYAGPSKHFKSNMCLSNVAAYLKKHDDSVCVFYDTEFGITEEYLKAFKIDPTRVFHVPIKDVEELKIEMVNSLESLNRGDHVVYLIDSLGQIASKKEVDDALEGNIKVDMSRAKALKSFTRLIANQLVLKDLPCVAVNHTYETQEMFSKTVMSGGTGILYSANTVIHIGRRQVKDKKELTGYDFILNIAKSRFVKEGSKIPLSVSFSGGINPWSGLIDIGLETGFIVKPKNGWFSRSFLNEETGEMVNEEQKYRMADTDNISFWGEMLKHAPFRQAVKNTYMIQAVDMMESLEDV